MATPVDRGDGWTVGSPKVGRAIARGAFALSLWGLAGLISVAPDLLHLPRLFGAMVDARAALLNLARICTVCVVALGALLARLQWADIHTGGGEVT